VQTAPGMENAGHLYVSIFSRGTGQYTPWRTHSQLRVARSYVCR
jgi:hypothetical protein